MMKIENFPNTIYDWEKVIKQFFFLGHKFPELVNKKKWFTFKKRYIGCSKAFKSIRYYIIECIALVEPMNVRLSDTNIKHNVEHIIHNIL